MREHDERVFGIIVDTLRKHGIGEQDRYKPIPCPGDRAGDIARALLTMLAQDDLFVIRESAHLPKEPSVLPEGF